MLYTSIGGYGGSSTRTELAAAIIAISCHGPVHIGTDSKAFRDKAICVIQDISQNKRRKRPWQTTTDGDLWAHFEQAVRAKGTNAIKISKVKGHVTAEQVTTNTHRAQDKAGNDKADETADIGTALYGKDVINIANLYHKRHNQYSQFMLDVAKHNVEAYLIHRKLIEKADAQSECIPNAGNAGTHVFHQPLVYIQHDSTETLHLPTSISCFHKLCKKQPCAPQIQHFLITLQAVPANDDGFTWLELYLLYRIRGYPKPIADNSNKARSKAPAARQLKAFVNTTRAIVARVGDETACKPLFKPCRRYVERFRTLGVAGNFPSVCFSVNVTTREAAIINKSITRLRTTMSNRDYEDFTARGKSIKVTKISLKAKVAWDTALSKQAPIARNLPDAHATCLVNATPSQASIADHFKCLTCPKCFVSLDYHKQIAKRTTKEPDNLLTCTRCKKSSKLWTWRCTCLKPWLTCSIHQHWPHHEVNEHDMSTPVTKGTKRKCAEHITYTQAQLQEIDDKNIERCAAGNAKRVALTWYNTPIKASFLSKGLQARFAYLLDEQPDASIAPH